ncbi:MFS transporter [Glycomyces harbinensis]|uniref:Predicted arabinose efflux permease, MFS family n=1 Tax=Glycomyces harbinensis TaxID=58114 RepID=A0A1G6Y703_9ACTN|nr:MFS transporter [Glycomyces harbinensis]SDD86150.1 Predicted arabinose efflux permease, MFS family [Glycomyces harbinensis]
MTATTTASSTRYVPAQMPVRIGPVHTPARRAVPVFALAALLATGQMYTPIPMFSAMEASWNVGLGAMTWVISAFAFGYAGGFLLFGPMADRFGQKRVLVMGLIAAGVVTLLTGLAPTFATALPLRVLQGLAVGTIPPAMTAYATSRIAPGRRAVAVATIVTSFLAATVIGQLASQTAIRFVDWRWVFIGSAVLFGLVAIAAHRIMLPDRLSGDASLARSYAAIPRVLRLRRLLPMLGAGSLAMAAMVAVYTGIELTGIVTGSGGLLALRASALPVMIALPFLAIPLARIARPSQVVLGTIVAAASMLAAAFAGGNLVVLAVLLAVLIGGLGIVAPATTQTAGELGGEHRAAASSVAMFSFYVGATVGPLVAQAAAAHGFPALAWTLAAMLSVAAGLALWGKHIQPTDA